MEKTNILIIGSGIAAVAAAEAARKQDPAIEIMVATKAHELPYYRLRLPERFSEPDKHLSMHTYEWYKDRDITLVMDREASALDAGKKLVEFTDGSVVNYQKLIIASGSRSFVPPIQGANGKHVHTLWTIEDSDVINQDMEPGTKAVVIGGGLLGLETAYKLHIGGAEVTVLETLPRVLTRQTDERSSALYKAKIESLGIHVLVSASTHEIKDIENDQKEVVLEDGRSIVCDIVIISTGVLANVEWLKGSGIKIDRRIVVNESMETNLPDVYAAGDIATQNGLWFGLWSVARSEGLAAGTNAALGDASYKLEVPPYVLNTMDTSLVAAGSYPDEKQPYEDLDVNENEFIYRRVIYQTEDKKGPVTGYILLGNTKDYLELQKRITK